MSTATHTPGPWVRMHDAYTESGAGITLGTTDHTEPVCSVSGYLRPLEANARLIQAAPETAAERDRLREEVVRLGRERDELRQAWAQDPQLVTWQTERDRLQAENAALVAALREANGALETMYEEEASSLARGTFIRQMGSAIDSARAALAAHAARTEGGTP